MPRTPEEVELLLNSYESDIAELKQTVEALLQAMIEIEGKLDDKVMPEGEYFGVKFLD